MAKDTYEHLDHWMRRFADAFLLQAVRTEAEGGRFLFELRFVDGREICLADIFAFDIWLAENKPDTCGGQLLGTHYPGAPRFSVVIFGILH